MIYKHLRLYLKSIFYSGKKKVSQIKTLIVLEMCKRKS
jgi:hypothetical protein